MQRITNTILTIAFTVAGIVAVYGFNFSFLEPILIPDPCAYHAGDVGSFMFNVFYYTPGFTGGHPFPTNLYLIATTLGGAFLGYVVYRTIKRWYMLKQHIH